MSGTSGQSGLTPNGLSLADAVVVDRERLGGVPVFRGTRVPVKNLFDYLRAGKPVTDFLDDFPGVSREQVNTVLDRAAVDLLRDVHAA